MLEKRTRFPGATPRKIQDPLMAFMLLPPRGWQVGTETGFVSVFAGCYCAVTVRFAGLVNGKGPLDVVIPPRRVAALPLVPTTQRRGELLAKCAVESHVTPDVRRAPHELVWVTSIPLESMIWAARSRATASRLVTKHTATNPFGSSTAPVNNRSAIFTWGVEKTPMSSFSGREKIWRLSKKSIRF